MGVPAFDCLLYHLIALRKSVCWSLDLSCAQKAWSVVKSVEPYLMRASWICSMVAFTAVYSASVVIGGSDVHRY